MQVHAFPYQSSRIWIYIYIYIHMYVCIHVYIHICMYVCIYIYKHTPPQISRASRYSHIHTCVYTYIHTHINRDTHTHISVESLEVCMYVCMNVCMHVYMYANMYVRMYVHASQHQTSLLNFWGSYCFSLSRIRMIIVLHLRWLGILLFFLKCEFHCSSTTYVWRSGKTVSNFFSEFFWFQWRWVGGIWMVHWVRDASMKDWVGGI